jgi:hypothetical protein
MDEARDALQIGGRVFETTPDGHLSIEDVRRHVGDLDARLAVAESENADLRRQLDHVASLRRLAEATVVKADELAAEIEAEARARAAELVAACEADLAERRRHFEADQAADLASARERVTQLQAALEGSVQTLARALQTVGAPALEMPPASAPLPPSMVFTPEAERAPSPPLTSPPPLEEETPSPPPLAMSATPAGPWESSDDGYEEAAVADEQGEADEDDRPITHVGTVEPPVLPTDRSQGRRGADRFSRRPRGDTAPPADADDPAARQAPPAAEDAAAEPLVPPAQPVDEVPPPPRPIDAPVTVPVDSGLTGGAVARRGPETIEIDMRPVTSFADLARVTKLLGGIAPGAQPVDLNLPQHRALFSVRGRDLEALAAQLAEALPEAKVVERQNGIDVLLAGSDE